MMIYELSDSITSFGIRREDFYSPYNAVINASSIYRDAPLYSLMKYQKEGDYYNFEDDFLIIYDPTEPTEKSHCFVRIRPIFFVENQKAILYLDSKLGENYTPTNVSISFKIVFKNSQTTYDGCLITPQNYIEVLNRVKKINDIDELYLLPNFYEK
ncbi:MAG: hypothetical protein HC880_08410 [Bacteroidia bacterium]|nr:hypothetical protein [Bacteroidia bacterium]